MFAIPIMFVSSAVLQESNPEANEHVAEAESASVLAYAIIMLNTDQHNPKSVTPMTFQVSNSLLSNCIAEVEALFRVKKFLLVLCVSTTWCL